MDLPRSELPRHIGGFTAGCLLVSNVVGSGIFTTTGFMARDLGHPGLILTVWFFGALLALAGALSYGELGTALSAPRLWPLCRIPQRMDVVHGRLQRRHCGRGHELCRLPASDCSLPQ